MAQIKIEDVIDHLSYEMKRALEAAVQDVAPNADIDRNELFRSFRRAVGRKCNTWVDVPSQLVKG